MQNPNPADLITTALNTLAEANSWPTGGKWLETLTVTVAPHLKEWDVASAWLWRDWPERESHFPGTREVDYGIDAVARRRSDGGYIAIQCKARQLDAQGRGDDIHKTELDKFVAASSNLLWTERWLVTNGDNRISANARQMAEMSDPKRPIKLINIHADLVAQQAVGQDEPCPHCHPDLADGTDEPPRQTKSCMQAEAVAQSVRLLREHEQSASGGLPIGEARGKIILPCGAGKTRVSLRIVEELTPPGALSIVLCPSIALVAQIRREYLQHAIHPIRALAVCSDETAGYDPKKESSRNTALDPTLDNSNVSASEVKGKVTTDAGEIGEWILESQQAPPEGQGRQPVSVIFGTYQSGHRIAEALRETGTAARVLIADEAHRTAGLRRQPKAEQRLRDFTLCHDNAAFPATYRVYQTATPKIYDVKRVSKEDLPSDWVVRSMDDEETFGVELYRKSYGEAVTNGWLADYRIIALGVNDPDSYAQANLLAANTQSKGKQALTTHNYIRGLAFALAMGGATRQREEAGTVPLQSCIAFMNTVDKSKNMAQDLAQKPVKDWLQNWLDNNQAGQTAADYSLEHLDATSKVSARENAKRRLSEANSATPHGIINVGIFGEGTDSPSLSAVAFLEPRKSPIDVIQAVGRAMRTAPGKDLGYIICPILIPPNADPENWLSSAAPEEGWQELGQILLALRAHDSRIEDNLAELLRLYIPKPPPIEHTLVALASGGPEQRISYREHAGPPGTAQEAITRVLDGKSTLAQEFQPVVERAAAEPFAQSLSSGEPGAVALAETKAGYTAQSPEQPPEPTQIIAGKKNADGSSELRLDTVARAKPGPDGTPGPVDIRKSKAKAKKMINDGTGIRLPDPAERRQQREAAQKDRAELSALRQLQLTGLEDHGSAIQMNLLTKSGLAGNRVLRDLNILETGIREAAHHLRSDELLPALNRHFGLDNLTAESRSKQADGCTIAALLLMNAAMLHQRIANGNWLSGIGSLERLKNDTQVARNLRREWERIMRHDFRPVLEPAVDAIDAVEATGKLAGLERALHHIAAEAERIAETYADLGADHAGPLFNRVMGNQASDGAFFTRPAAAAIAAKLTLDAAGPNAWANPQSWQNYKAVDLACGSGTLLAALLAEMKTRARQQGANEPLINQLQKTAVENLLHGLDINPVSLQLAAAQLTAGNADLRYRRMGLHRMPYGPPPDNPGQVAAGSLELLGQSQIVPRPGAMNLGDDQIPSRAIWPQTDAAELEDAVDAAKNARIVIMNPPFTNRANVGEKFDKPIQQALRQRADDMERLLVNSDQELVNFVDKNALSPMFIALAEKCNRSDNGVLTMINPTVALSAPAGLEERRILAQRYHIHTILTGHAPGQINLSQHTNINESLIVAVRQSGTKPPTRFINLDRMPVNDDEVAELHHCLTQVDQGAIPEGWGEVSYWPAERMAAGDWTAAIWRSPELAEAAWQYANNAAMQTVETAGLSPAATGQQLRGSYERAAAGLLGSFPILKSKGADAQTRIQSQPDEYWIPKKRDESILEVNGGTYPKADRILQKAGHLLITAGQDNSTGRVTATADDEKYIGNGWMPVIGLTAPQGKALAVFLNSTPGRLQLMRNAGKKLEFPTYSASEASRLRIPDLQDARVCQILADCWARTREWVVPQFRDGECEVRQEWDAAVAAAMHWNPADLAHYRRLLHREPHVRGLGYNQYGDAVGDGE